MTDSFYLVFSIDGVQKMTKVQKPSLKSGQRGIEMTVTIPDGYFERPFTEINVEVAGEDLIAPPTEVQVEESKYHVVDEFRSMYESLPERRQAFVRQELRDISVALYEWLFEDLGSAQSFTMVELASALELVARHFSEQPDLPETFSINDTEEADEQDRQT